MRRREFIAALGGAAAWPVTAGAQQRERTRRLGVLMFSDGKDAVAHSFLKELQTTLEGRGWNVELDVRWGGGGERGTANAEQLMLHPPDAIVVNGTALLIAAQRTTKTVPIVFINVSDPVGGGLIQSMARPGGNSTGFTNYEDAFAGKWLELLKEGVPNLQRSIAMQDPLSPAWVGQLSSLKSAATNLRLQLVPAEVRDVADIQRNLDAVAGRADTGLVLLPSVITVMQRRLIIELALKHKVPAIYPFSIFARDGGLMSYGTPGDTGGIGVALYVDRIFRGERPGDIPVQAPTRLQLFINRNTAKEIGVEIAPSLLVRADEVIE